MAAISDPGAPAGESPDAYAARMAAIQRALGSGASGLVPPTNGYQGSGGIVSAPIGPPQAPGATIGNDITSGLNPLQPAGTPTMATIPGQNAPIQLFGRGQSPTSSPQGPDAIQRALDAARPTAPTPQQAATGGSVGTAPRTPATTGGSIGPSLAPSAPAAPPAPVAVEPTGAGQAPIDTSGAGGAGSLQGLTGSIMQQIQGIQSGLNSPGTPIDVTAVYLKQSQSILDMLNQQEASLRAEAEKQGTQVDPATQFTIDKLRETLDANLKSTREDLNRRGLYDSGILLQLENNLQKGSASDQAQILATRLSKLQQDLQTGLTNIGNQKFQTASQYGLAGANAQSASDSQGRTLAQQREQQALAAMLSLRGQQASEQASAAALAQNQSQFNSTQAFNAQQSALQRAASAASSAASSAAAGQMTPYQQAQIALQQQALQNANAGKYSATNTDQFIASIPQGASRESALATLQTNANVLQQQGVDLTAARQWILTNLVSQEQPPPTGAGGVR